MTLVAGIFRTAATYLTKFMPIHDGYYFLSLSGCHAIPLHDFSEMLRHLPGFKMVSEDVLSGPFLSQDKTGCQIRDLFKRVITILLQFIAETDKGRCTRHTPPY